ncbi:MAG: MFS transporter [Ignavibacteria bacterium]|nr:MFS transporter [Ignavibacteria bacterium]
MKSKFLTKTIIILSAISFFTDVASEMLYPIIPIYLKSVGFSIALIGLLEGVAESLAGLSKGFFGAWSDKIGRRVPFIRFGYALSSISKPLMGLFPFPFLIFIFRTFDRLGKGIRTSARDALLSDESTNEHKGKVFGFHRSLDTFGAVVGPLITLLLISFFIKDYRFLFILSAIPGLVVIALCFLLKEKKSYVSNSTKKYNINFFVFWNYLVNSSSNYKKVVIPLLLFSLFNSSDFFLLLKLKEYGFTDHNVILFYILFNLSYSIFSYPIGKLADKFGLHKLLAFGLFIFSFVYFSVNISGHTYWLLVTFFIYGLFNASTEGVSKALITNLVSKEETATALGSYNSFASITTLLASSMTGLIWNFFGSTVALCLSGAVGIIIFIYFAFLFKLK